MANDLSLLYALIRQYEGLYLTPYYCPAGILTVGYGTTGHGVYPGIKWTKEECEARMMSDVQKFVRGTLKLCPILATDDRKLCAISDFSYNLGLGNLQASTLRQRINKEDWAGAKLELLKWTRGGGKILPGLVRRRISESLLLE